MCEQCNKTLCGFCGHAYEQDGVEQFLNANIAALVGYQLPGFCSPQCRKSYDEISAKLKANVSGGINSTRVQ